MNILFLRGHWPTDRKDPSEIVHKRIEDEDDVWTELAYAMTGPKDRCTVLYGGHKHVSRYSDNFEVRFVKSLKKYEHPVKPDVIIARGGFDDYLPVLKRNHWATKIYYGAGKRAIPGHEFTGYDIVLVDSDEQMDMVRKRYPYMNVQRFIKPASHIFTPQDRPKKYDVCFVAIHPKDKRKRVLWVWDTVPKDISVLQLGNSWPGKKPPPNVAIKSVGRTKMPKAMSRCRVGIAPYGSEDSCPRVVPEFFACDMPVVARTSLRVWHKYYPVFVEEKVDFWTRVRKEVKLAEGREQGCFREHYDKHLSLSVAAKWLKDIIGSLEHE